VETAKLQLRSDILQTQKELNVAKKNYQNSLISKPFQPATVIAYDEEVESLERGLAKLKKLEQLF
jgi:hypothetical protein